MKFRQVKQYVKRFVKDDTGAELVEYAIGISIVAILAGAVFAVVTLVKQKITDAGTAIGEIDPAGAVGGGGGGITSGGNLTPGS